MIIGEAPIIVGAPLVTFPNTSRHREAVKAGAFGRGVAPQTVESHNRVGVLSHTISAWYPPGRVTVAVNTPAIGFEHPPGQETVTVALLIQSTMP